MIKKLPHRSASLRQFTKYFPEYIINDYLLGHQVSFLSAPGLFNAQQIDTGSRLLLNSLQISSTSKVLDLGCGFGTIGIALALQDPSLTMTLTDKDFIAIEYAKENIKRHKLKNTKAYLSNGFSHISPQKFDIVISAVPTHVGKVILTGIFMGAKKFLTPTGKIYVVTVSKQKSLIKRLFIKTFGNYTKIIQDKVYTVSMAENL